jgi:hypothetical protein
MATTVRDYRQNGLLFVLTMEVNTFNCDELNFLVPGCRKMKSRHQNEGQKRIIKIAKKSFENVEKFKYLGKTVINKNTL